MNLAARGAARQREKIVMRFGCFLVTLAVLASLVLEPPRAKAFAVTSSAVTALAGAYLNACGLAPVVSGMSSSQEVNESLARLIQDYLDTELPGTPLTDWLGNLSNLSLVHDAGWMLLLPTQAAASLHLFASWVAGKYGTQPGVNEVYSEVGSYFLLENGFKFYLSNFESTGSPIYLSSSFFSVPGDFPVYLSTGYYISSAPSSDAPYSFTIFDSAGTQQTPLFWAKDPCLIYFGFKNGYGFYGFEDRTAVNKSWYCFADFEKASVDKYFGELYSFDESLSLDVSDTMQEVLDRLTALEEGQSIALDVGATQSMEIQEILQGILDAILAGDLVASAEIVDEAVEPVEPDPPVVPVVPEGLDKLGAALTSRFPFSIPWDVYKGVTLLAAPPKAPYFEVDFLEPIGHLVGGWKGSTKIVLDMSEYEIIGQVCRWTSTIGFCLFLASGTKRLIWTA